jgi:hypothetical protein
MSADFESSQHKTAAIRPSIHPTHLSGNVKNALVTSKVAIDRQWFRRDIFCAVRFVKQVPCYGSNFLEAELDSFNYRLCRIASEKDPSSITD